MAPLCRWSVLPQELELRLHEGAYDVPHSNPENLGGDPLARQHRGVGCAGTDGPAVGLSLAARVTGRRLRYPHVPFRLRGSAAANDSALCTLGAPKRDATGRVTNAVLILHGT